MFSQGNEYLEDGLLAKDLAQKEATNALYVQTFKRLQSEADEAYTRLLLAQENRLLLDQLNHLQSEWQALQNKADEAKKNMEATRVPAKNGVEYILSRLSMAEAKSDELKVAPALRAFSTGDMEKINTHYAKLPKTLQDLMSAAIRDDGITTELMANPVFIKRDGHVYSKEIIDEMLAATGSARSPLNSSILFTKADIVPCNSLIKAMTSLLDVIGGEEKLVPLVGQKLATLSSSSRTRVSAQDIGLIEKTYNGFAPKHKLLFDAVCRDPVTHIIMDDPVLLPDGYVYDRKTAGAYLAATGGKCPSNSAIRFAETDITPCHFVIGILDTLKSIILQAQAKAAEAKAVAAPAAEFTLRR